MRAAVRLREGLFGGRGAQAGPPVERRSSEPTASVSGGGQG
jgi:hypothetical protein